MASLELRPFTCCFCWFCLYGFLSFVFLPPGLSKSTALVLLPLDSTDFQLPPSWVRPLQACNLQTVPQGICPWRGLMYFQDMHMENPRLFPTSFLKIWLTMPWFYKRVLSPSCILTGAKPQWLCSPSFLSHGLPTQSLKMQSFVLIGLLLWVIATPGLM